MNIDTGHSSLNAHLQKIGVFNDPTCRACEGKDETSLRILCSCESLQGLTVKYFEVEELDLNEIQDIPIGTVLDFARSTGLLKE